MTPGITKILVIQFISEPVKYVSTPFPVSTEYMDFRFFKDLELKENFFFCCCCKRHALEMYVEDKDSKASERDPSAGAFTAPHILLHPEAAKVERIVRNAWAQARLVAD